MKIQRITLMGEYQEYRRDRARRLGTPAPSARIVAGYCLQYPAPLQTLDNLSLPFGKHATAARTIVADALRND